MVTKYVRQWLDLPISATMSSIILSHRRFGQAFQLPAVEYQQCQTLCSSLKSCGDEAVTKSVEQIFNMMSIGIQNEL